MFFAASRPAPPARCTVVPPLRQRRLHHPPPGPTLQSQVSTSQAASLLGRAEVEGSDLLPGQYEGGFKVWEGGVDLAEYVARLWGAGSAEPSGANEPAQPSGSPEAAPVAAASEAAGAGCAGVGRQLAGQRVLELGCGHALPGLVALLAGAEVHFQVRASWGLAGEEGVPVPGSCVALPPCCRQPGSRAPARLACDACHLKISLTCVVAAGRICSHALCLLAAAARQKMKGWPVQLSPRAACCRTITGRCCRL